MEGAGDLNIPVDLPEAYVFQDGDSEDSPIPDDVLLASKAAPIPGSANFASSVPAAASSSSHGDGRRQSNSRGGSGQVNVHETMPTVVRNFILVLHSYVKQENVFEVRRIYRTSFNNLTEKYFANSAWPPVSSVAQLVDQDAVFIMLYRELYFRHVYSRLKPSRQHRFESWENYTLFFDYLLNTDSPQSLKLPTPWLWDIIDEFIYQFQEFCQYRSKLKTKREDEITLLKANPQVWNIKGVLFYLNALMNKSNVIRVLDAERLDLSPEEKKASYGEFGAQNTYLMLGYFSLIGLTRVHCMLSDYHTALRTLDHVDVAQGGPYPQVTDCYVTLYYYMGFCYLMTRRYDDAINTFSSVLLYISRTKDYHNSRNSQHDQMMKKVDRMYALLAIAVTLSPQRIDESVHTTLRDKNLDKMQRMQRGELSAFEELFCYGCPKFVTVAAPNYDQLPAQNTTQDALRRQVSLFIKDISQQAALPVMRSYLKLYTTIGTAKLASFLDTDEESVRTQLACIKHKTYNLTWSHGLPPVAGSYSSSDIHFYLNGDMVHVSSQRAPRRFMEYFLRHTQKTEDILRRI